MDLTEGIVVSVALVVGSVTDLRDRVIPDVLTLPAAGLVALSGLVAGPPFPSLLAGLLTATMICLPLGAISILRPASFGMGDVKLIAVMALAAGPAVWLPLVAGFGIATIFGFLRALSRGTRPGETTLPLAPFLAVPGVAFFGSAAIF